MVLGVDIGQFQYEYSHPTNGGYALFGADTNFEVISVDGLDLPAIRSGDVQAGGTDGSVPGQDRMDVRTIDIKMEYYGTDELVMWQELHALNKAFDRSDIEQPLTFKIGSQSPMRSYCRARHRDVPMTVQHLYQFVEINLQLVATDPRVYAEAASTSSAAAPTVPAARAFSATFPYNFGAAGVGGVVSAYNEGTMDAPWTARIVGPCVNPTIIGPDGSQLTWESSLAAGEFLDINGHPLFHTVQVGGTSSRFTNLSDTSDWFLLPPGSSNVTLNTGDGNGSVQFAWRSTWNSAT